MRRLPIAPLLALAALAAATRADSPGSGAETPEPIATRQTIFSIPFQIQKAQNSAQEPAEIRLYVSTDRGATWRPYTRVEPSRGHFLFQAVGDGEYWFLVRTLDRSGQVRPQGPNRPELRVMVDTTPPTLQLEAARGDAGQIVTRWRVRELAPRRDSLKIQYRTAPDAPWQPVAIDWRKVKVDGPTQTGEVTWWPRAGAGNLVVRAEVSDLAGNRAVTHAQIKTDRAVAATAEKPTDTKPSQATQSDTKPTDTKQSDESDVAAVPAQKWRSAKSETPAATGPAAHTLPTPLAREQTPSATDPAQTGPPPDSVAGTVNPAIQNQYVPPARQQTPAETGGTADRRTDFKSVPRGTSDRPPDVGRISNPSHGTTKDRPPDVGRISNPSHGTLPDRPSVPPPGGTRPRMINSRIFELEYDAGAAGASGVGRVELWGTRDGGWIWDSFGQDADGRSPMLVTVPDDGIYGFRVVAQSDPRSPPQRPRSGESPDVWIGIDLAKPAARILSAERGTGAESAQLVIHWEASDRMLAARPVSLFYADVSGGNWLVIASGLENTGVYGWVLDGRVPERISLRLEVRDEAGNLAVYETPQAVTIQRPSTGARIRDVRPVGQSARRAPKRYYFR